MSKSSMKDVKCAPIAVFGYNRIDKIKACIEALERCEIATDSDLYIFADGSKGDKDREKVEAVHQWVNQYSEAYNKSLDKTFKSVTTKVRDVNAGLAVSIISGVTELMDKYGKVIVVEDDLLVSPYFLRYMNDGLDFYKDDDRVWAMASYGYDLKALRSYKHDIYAGYRASSWGWASWKDRWDTVDWEVSDYDELMQDGGAQKRFCRGGGDLLTYLKMQMEGKMDSWAIRWNYSASKQDKVTIYPRRGLVSNRGFDGSGTHNTGKSGYADVLYLPENGYDIKLEKILPDARITREFYLLHTDTFWKKVKRNLSFRDILKLIKRATGNL